jgi:hypothetical protein
MKPHAPAALPPGKSLQHLLNRTLGEPQDRSGHFEDETQLLPLPEFEPQIVQPVA